MQAWRFSGSGIQNGKKDSETTEKVSGGTVTGILGLRFFSVPVLDNGGVYFVFIFSHLYLHGSRIRGDLHVPEMVEEKQYAKSQANGVGDFQNGEASGAFPGDLGINPGKKRGYVRSLY